MSASFVQLGQAVDFVPSRDIAAGEILVCNLDSRQRITRNVIAAA